MYKRQEHPHADQQQHRQPVDQRIGQQRVALRGTERDLDVLVPQLVDLVFGNIERTCGLDDGTIRQLAGDRLTRDGDCLDRPGIGFVEELAIADLRGRGAVSGAPGLFPARSWAHFPLAGAPRQATGLRSPLTCGMCPPARKQEGAAVAPVSYTHLTLPTSDLV